MIDLIEARPWHCKQIIRLISVEQQQASRNRGFDPLRELRAHFHDSALRRAVLIDGRLIAVGGVTGSLISDTGEAWVALAADASRHRMAIVRAACRHLEDIMVSRSQLIAQIVHDDEKAIRFAIFLGFVPVGMGLSPAFSRYGRRLLADHARACDNDTRAVIMALHGG